MIAPGLWRQALFGIGLGTSLALLIGSQNLRIDLAQAQARQANTAASAAKEDAERHLQTLNTLTLHLAQERSAQLALRNQQAALRQGLAEREHTIEALKRENTELRDWAAQPLPELARRLRQRPALTGADAYRQWLSGRGAVPSAGEPAIDQRRATH
jgi:LysB family phage lysis regulatory protein